MSQNVFLDTGFNEEDATIFVLEADSAASIAGFIQRRFSGNQAAAAKQLKLHQSEISALLAGNVARFSLSKLIRVARRAGIRLYLDMGDNASDASATTLRPTIIDSPVNEIVAEMDVELTPGQVKTKPADKRVTKAADARH